MLCSVMAAAIAMAILPAGAHAAYYVMGVTDKMSCATAFAPQELGYWQDRGIDARIALQKEVRNRWRTKSRRM